MLSKRWFRFGLPLGSAAIVVAMLDTTMGAYWLLNEIGSSLFFHWWDHDEPISNKGIVTLSLVSSRTILALSTWIFVLLKQRAVLIFWIPLSVISDVIFIGHSIVNHPRDFVTDELWICNIFLFFLIRFYVTAIMFQTLIRLLRNARMKTGSFSSSSLNSPETTQNIKYYLVEPIGKSPLSIWRYYDKIPRLGAAVLVAFEISWTMFVLSTHVLTEYMMGGRLFFLHREEEIIMRAWRIVIDAVVLIFILQKRKTLLRFWLIVYFWSLFLSIGLTIWTIVEWTFETPLVVVIVICFTGISDIMLRFGVIYFCLMLSLQASISVSRTQSLKSETRSLRPTIHSSRLCDIAERAILSAENHI